MKKNKKCVGDIVVVAPSFPRRFINMARAIEEVGRLRAFVAGYAYDPNGLWERAVALLDKISHSRFQRILARRTVDGIGAEKCRCTPVVEILSFIGRLPWIRERGIRYHDLRQKAIDRFAASLINVHTRIVIAREDGALLSFQRGKKSGCTTIYDLPTAHYRTTQRIMQQEEERFPGVCQLLHTQSDFAPKRIEHKEKELNAADYIIAGSSFVKQSLLVAGLAHSSIVILPSAFEISWRSAHPKSLARKEGQKCLVLHIGQLSLRKGTHRLLRAWKKLNAHHTNTLRLIGKMHLSDSFLQDFKGCFEHIGRVVREELRTHYTEADFFVLPAAAEGFAMVILEALSCALPVVVSRNSGAEGFIEHRKHGLLHKFEDEDELCAQIDWMLSHPVERVEMSRQAWLKAAEWTWKDYRAKFIEIIGSIESH